VSIGNKAVEAKGKNGNGHVIKKVKAVMTTIQTRTELYSAMCKFLARNRILLHMEKSHT
jgi:hypothetical protein